MTVVPFVQQALALRADPERAGPMQAYLKTDMPFLGVPRPGQKEVFREVKRQFKPKDRSEWEQSVRALWALPHREEKYLALDYAGAFKPMLTFASVPLLEQLIREGAWWDLVDGVAANLIGHVVRTDRERMRPILTAWIDDEDLWIRRTAVICQIRHKGDTDVAMLLDFCRRRAHEKVFWMRKAIGWALRDHARTDPDTVRAFLDEMGDGLSGLSRREAGKHLNKAKP